MEPMIFSGLLSDFLTAAVCVDVDLVSDNSSRLTFFCGLDGSSSSTRFLFFDGLLDGKTLAGPSWSWSFRLARSAFIVLFGWTASDRLSCGYEQH